MAISFKKFWQGLKIVPKTTSTANSKGDVEVIDASGKIQYHNGVTVSPVVTETHAATLTGKTLVVASNVITTAASGNLVATELNAALAELDSDITSGGGNLAAHINNPTGAHAASAISNIPAGNLAAINQQAANNELQSDIDSRATSSALTAHTGASSGVHGVVGSVVGTSDAQTLTNKTIVVINNTVTTAASGNLVATELNAALSELQGDIDTRATTSALGAHTGASTGVHGVTGAVVGTTDVQTLTNKIITGADIRTPVRSDVKQDTLPNLTTYATTASNGQLVFATDAKIMSQVVDGVLVAVGSGSGGGDVDSLLTQTFDSSIVADFVQTGLSFNTIVPIHGSQSAQLIHQSAINQSFKQTLAVDRKFRGQLNELSLSVRSTASEGNLTIVVTDETNAVIIAASQSVQTSSVAVSATTTSASTTISGISNVTLNSLAAGMAVSGAGIAANTLISSINLATSSAVLTIAATASATVTLRASSTPARRAFQFTIPNNCLSLSYTITALPEANLPVSMVDDLVVVLASTALLSTSVVVPVLTSWQAYVPTFTGFGTVTGSEMQWRRNGENVEIRGKFVSGVSTAVEARISLPNGYTSANTSLIPSIQVIGKGSKSATATTFFGGTSILIEPSVAYMTLGFEGSSFDGTTKVTSASSFIGSGNILSFFASVPVSGLSATTVTAIPLTQSGIITDADSYMLLTSPAASSGVVNFGTILANQGSAFSKSGGDFTITQSGTYDITANVQFAGVDNRLLITKNSTTTSITSTDMLSWGSTQNTGGYEAVVTWSGPLIAGDIIRFTSPNTPSNLTSARASISYQGSLKQVSVNTNSKITIPTSELRFEGSSTLGTGLDSAIVVFNTLAKIRGDAFTIVSTPATGTYITMNKAGRLNVSTTLSGAIQATITKNQITRTVSTPLASESIATIYIAVGGSVANASGTTDVIVGDVIRVAASSAATSSALNIFTLSFQEQSVQVSVSNTLPQFSDSDSSVRVGTANGYGSTATTTRRFSSVAQNIGTDIAYTDSPSLGAQFVAQSSGIYNVSYTENSTANVRETGVFIRVNGTNVAYDGQVYNTTTADNKIACASWQGYLTQGDIVTPAVQIAASSNGADVIFTMSKVGKPNVTGVNVTPFVNVPQPFFQSIYLDSAATFNNAIITGPLTKNTNTGIFSYNPTTGIYAVLKAAKFSMSLSVSATGANIAQAAILVNNATVAVGANDAATSTSWGSTSYLVELSIGETFNFTAGSGSSSFQRATVLAEALSDQILTAPETFSTDTAALAYAGSGTYTLATLANAPVGTYITFDYAANTNTRNQVVSTRPTQTDADMNANGIRIFTRAYNASSAASQPAAIAIQIGKGQKGVSQNLYKSAGKVTAGGVDYTIINSADSRGLNVKDYNENTGILILDAGLNPLASITGVNFSFSDQVTQASGYLVINASKNASLVGIGLNRVSARAIQTSGQSVAISTNTTVVFDTTKTYDTTGSLNTATGIYTANETGYYQINGGILSGSLSFAAGNFVDLAIFKNGAVHTNGKRETVVAASTSNVGATINDTVFLAKGETVNLAVFTNRTGGISLIASVGWNFFSVSKVSI